MKITRTARTSTRGNVTRRVLAGAAVAGGLLAATSSAEAGRLNERGCRPSADKPYPVVVVHGQAGAFEGMTAITDSLSRAGYCVYARNYGLVPGGANGQDHLSNSAIQIGGFVDEILHETGARKVNFVSHSAGTGVVGNYIQAKNGASRVHRVVSFGGLHHPYAHVGIANAVDMSIYLPHLIGAARLVSPRITAPDVVKKVLELYGKVGAPFGMVDPALRATMESNFTADLFDPVYWKELHGDHSEGWFTFIRIGPLRRSKQTNDAAPNVCYTNIVAVADLLAGASAATQDEGPNVENFVLTSSVTPNAHNDMLGDPVAIDKMLAGLGAPCTPAQALKTFAVGTNEAPPPSAEEEDAANAFKTAIAEDEELGEPRGFVASQGCGVSRGSSTTEAGGLLGLGLAFVAWTRRRRSAGAKA